MLGAYDYAGGVSQGENVAAAIHVGPVNTSAWGDSFQSNLDAKKSYFMFDNEIVCMGNSIYCTDGTEVITVIDNRTAYAGDKLRINDTVTTLDANTEIQRNNVTSAYFTSMGGYYFPDGNTKTLKINKAVGADTWTFYELWYSHGVNPTDDTYSYVMLPTATPEETVQYSEDPDITIIRNDRNVQAVSDRSTGSTGYIFWKGDTCGNVTASTKCSAMVTDDGSKFTISLSDPNQTASSVTLTVTDVPAGCRLVSKDQGVTVTKNGTTITFTADTQNAQGKSFTAEFEQDVDYGDLNSDGYVNATDALIALQISCGKRASSAEYLSVGDVDGNGVINTTDALLIVRYGVGLIDKFPIEN